MYENSVYEIELAPVTFWPPALARRLGDYIRQAVTIAIAAGCLVGIALGFAGVSDGDDTIFQSVLHSVAIFTGLIG